MYFELLELEVRHVRCLHSKEFRRLPAVSFEYGCAAPFHQPPLMTRKHPKIVRLHGVLKDAQDPYELIPVQFVRDQGGGHPVWCPQDIDLTEGL